MHIAIIAACDDNNGIGKDGKIPWKNKADLRFFKATTQGGQNNAVIMGRRTFESIGMPLDGRLNIVLSRHDSTKSDLKTYILTDSLPSAIKTCQQSGITHAWICGGQEVYEQAVTQYGSLGVSKCLITNIKGNFDCDTYFPELISADWSLDTVSELDAGTTVRVFNACRKTDCQ